MVLPQNLNSFLARDYHKYLHKYDGEREVTTEEHLVHFYYFVDNYNVQNQDVWIRLFVQSLDGEARKWFRGLPANSIIGIKVLDDVFLKNWGDKKDYLYYITKFWSLKRKNDESVSYFSKRFNKMYDKIPDEVNQSETSAKINFSNRFELKFSLLLRERRSTKLESMLEEAIELEAIILVAEIPRNKFDRGDREKKK